MTPFVYRHPIEAHTVAPDLTDAERANVERLAAAPAFVGGDAADDFASDRADAISRDTHTTTPDAAAAYERHWHDVPRDDRPTHAEAERDHDEIPGLDGYDQSRWP